MLIGEYSITSGEARVFNILSDKLVGEDMTKISAVMDNFGIYERLTIYENMEVFANIYRVDKKEIDEILKKVELFDAKKTIAGKLSKGMTQRLILARALINKPKLIFLDEPTSGLDPATSLKIHNLLFELKKSGTTVFLTTHNMEEASKMCDEVALLKLGKIVEFGKPKDICMRYNKQKEFSVITSDNKKQIFTSDKSDLKKLASLLEYGEVISIHSSEPTLEMVFINLTGKELV